MIGKWKSSTNLFVQCKHINRKLQPATVRELEGVLMRLDDMSSINRNNFDNIVSSSSHECIASSSSHESIASSTAQECSATREDITNIGMLISSTEWSVQSINRLQGSPLLLIGMVVDVEKESISNLFINRNLQSKSKKNLHFEYGKSLDGNDLVINLTDLH